MPHDAWNKGSTHAGHPVCIYCPGRVRHRPGTECRTLNRELRTREKELERREARALAYEATKPSHVSDEVIAPCLKKLRRLHAIMATYVGWRDAASRLLAPVIETLDREFGADDDIPYG